MDWVYPHEVDWNFSRPQTQSRPFQMPLAFDELYGSDYDNDNTGRGDYHFDTDMYLGRNHTHWGDSAPMGTPFVVDELYRNFPDDILRG